MADDNIHVGLDRLANLLRAGLRLKPWPNGDWTLSYRDGEEIESGQTLVELVERLAKRSDSP